VTAPPRLAERLLLRRLAVDERDELIGDINEQFTARAAADGARSARLWYWRQALALVWGFSIRRRDLISTAHERTRGAWFTGNLATDLRHAWRGLRYSPSFALVAFLTLTFGIGLSTAVFSLVGGILVSPLPYAHPERIVRITEFAPGQPVTGDGGLVSDVALGAWVSTASAVTNIAPYTDNDITVGLPDGGAKLQVAEVGGDFFIVLAQLPVAGRVLNGGDLDPAAPATAVISERLANRSFGGAQSALGKSVTLETRTHVVVGVLSSRFGFPSRDVDIWTPGRQYRNFPTPGEQRNMHMSTDTLALLREGQTVADADQSGARVAMALAQADPSFADGTVGLSHFRTHRLLDDMVAPIRPALVMLGGGMVIVLFAACVNLANLILTRHTARQREFAVRLALGATRWRVARPVLIEVVMLCGAGGSAGALVAWWLLRGLPSVAPGSLPRVESIHFDARTLLFALAASAVTGVVAAWLPVTQLPSSDVRELTSSSGRFRVGRFTRSADQLRGVLVVGQVAMAVMLLVAALLIGRSLSALLHVNLGYRPDGVLAVQAAQPFIASREPGRLTRYYTDLVDRIKHHPNVVSVGIATAFPLHSIGLRSSVSVVGRPIDTTRSEDRMAVNMTVSADYLPTIGTRLLKGRGFSDADSATSEHVMLIDSTLDERFFPAGDAIGSRIRLGRFEWTIVGIVEAIRVATLTGAPPPVMYFPAAQNGEFSAYGWASVGVAIRTTGSPMALAGFVREAAKAADPSVPLYRVQPLADDISSTVAEPRFFTVVIGLFALLSLSTALLGIYGVLAFSVERRRVEFGVRRALGASERDIAGLVMRRGLALSVIGLALGLGGASVGARFLRSILFGVTTADALSFAGAAAVVLAVVALASWRPVRRALAIDPARALRVD
jgi:predicted permease